MLVFSFLHYIHISLQGSWIGRTKKKRKSTKTGLDLDFNRTLDFPVSIKPVFAEQVTKDAKVCFVQFLWVYFSHFL